MSSTTAAVSTPGGDSPGAGSRASATVRSPASVRAAGWLWVAAVATGIAETAIMVGPDLTSGALDSAPLTGLGVRAVIYTAVIVVVTHLWRGRRWARVALAVGLGGVGMLSLVTEPLLWTLHGGSPVEALAGADASFLAQVALRAGHIVAVVAAMVMMFLPAANRYFRSARSAG